MGLTTMMTIVSYLRRWRCLLTMRAVMDWMEITLIAGIETVIYVLVRGRLLTVMLTRETLGRHIDG